MSELFRPLIVARAAAATWRRRPREGDVLAEMTISPTHDTYLSMACSTCVGIDVQLTITTGVRWIVRRCDMQREYL
jgi:hypothetical protein